MILEAKRLPGWPERLADYIEARRHVPFAWGRNDCASFAAGAVDAMTDAGLEWRIGDWDSEEEASYILRVRGGLTRAAARVLGQPIRGPRAALASRGSVVCVRLPRPTLGIAAGNGYWCAPGADGLVWRPMTEVRRAWEI